jgi:hypothetical protein
MILLKSVLPFLLSISIASLLGCSDSDFASSSPRKSPVLAEDPIEENQNQNQNGSDPTGSDDVNF